MELARTSALIVNVVFDTFKLLVGDTIVDESVNRTTVRPAVLKAAVWPVVLNATV
jgi:hypothetical protein